MCHRQCDDKKWRGPCTRWCATAFNYHFDASMLEHASNAMVGFAAAARGGGGGGGGGGLAVPPPPPLPSSGWGASSWSRGGLALVLLLRSPVTRLVSEFAPRPARCRVTLLPRGEGAIQFCMRHASSLDLQSYRFAYCRASRSCGAQEQWDYEPAGALAEALRSRDDAGGDATTRNIITLEDFVRWPANPARNRMTRYVAGFVGEGGGARRGGVAAGGGEGDDDDARRRARVVSDREFGQQYGALLRQAVICAVFTRLPSGRRHTYTGQPVKKYATSPRRRCSQRRHRPLQTTATVVPRQRRSSVVRRRRRPTRRARRRTRDARGRRRCCTPRLRPSARGMARIRAERQCHSTESQNSSPLTSNSNLRVPHPNQSARQACRTSTAGGRSPLSAESALPSAAAAGTASATRRRPRASRRRRPHGWFFPRRRGANGHRRRATPTSRARRGA